MSKNVSGFGPFLLLFSSPSSIFLICKRCTGVCLCAFFVTFPLLFIYFIKQTNLLTPVDKKLYSPSHLINPYPADNY